MPKIIFNATAEQKERYHVAAHGELVTLSEWIRSVLDERLAGKSVPRVEPAVELLVAAGDAARENGGDVRPDFKPDPKPARRR